MGKLVRDRIPEIIRSKGEEAVVRVLDEAEYRAELVRKLHEEVAEFTEAESVEELADIQEVVLALADLLASRENLEHERAAKAEKRGAFNERFYLE